MSRLRRVHVPGAVYHVIARFVAGEFRLRNDEDRAEYLARVPGALAKTDWRVIANSVLP